MKIPLLYGPRVTLRSLELSDAPRYVRWFKDKEVIRYLLLQTGITLKEERKYIRSLAHNKDHFNLAIITENGKHIGGSGTTLYPKDKRADIGVVIGDKAEWGKGYSTEALNLIADYIFRKLKYNRLELTVSMDNKAALKAYKKVGFKLEGIKLKVHRNLITKKFEDNGFMAILSKDWLNKHK
ncbi:MAG TPA: GNAT family N-acetyltransferase [Candidatus Udaeobacter sp.]|nr:GNAT family N-acetyltransferase [Candidatus Udaeobacter sp.]